MWWQMQAVVSSGVFDLQQYLFWMCFEAVANGARLLHSGIFAAFNTIEHNVPSCSWCALVHSEHQEGGQVASSSAKVFAAEL